jgi:hypothetical protein
MINNIELIEPLLHFTEDGDFYMLSVFKRKKDQPIEERNNHQSARIIKTYCIDSLEHLYKTYDEIKQLCEMFKARAYIHIQKQNHKDISLEMIQVIAKRIQMGQINQKNVFDSVVGQLKTLEKRWIVDIDVKDQEFVREISAFINTLRPEGNKIETIIPTKSGFHLITKRFDVIEFNKMYPNIDIQKKNPTLCYFPSSLMD